MLLVTAGFGFQNLNRNCFLRGGLDSRSRDHLPPDNVEESNFGFDFFGRIEAQQLVFADDVSILLQGQIYSRQACWRGGTRISLISFDNTLSTFATLRLNPPRFAETSRTLSDSRDKC